MLSRKKQVLFSLIVLLLLALLVEGLSYVYVYKLKDNALGAASERNEYAYFRGHELNPQYQREFDTGGRRIHSADGFRRDQPVSVKKPEGVYRIILFGGSQAYGVGSQHGGVYPPEPSLQNNETVSYFLEQTLNRGLSAAGVDLRVEVINAAAIAYKVYQHLLYFNERLYQYDADLLVFLDGHNDFYPGEPNSNPMLTNVYAKDLVWQFNGRGALFAFYSGARWLGQYSYFFKLLEKGLQDLLPRVNPYQAPAVADVSPADYRLYARDNYLRFYQQFRALAEIYGFSMHLFIQPEILLEDPALLSEHDRMIYRISDEYGDRESKTSIHPQLQGVFADSGLAVTDFTQLAPDNDKGLDLYFDYTHLTPDGSALLADNMAQVLLPQIRGM
ncbi:hypothetical protein Q4485_16120 [Granulosicoccaceae sp. 1_MG-2023]|nr:hypothetical protein [Granulosicoccaceae sp. 1_MG-2023]